MKDVDNNTLIELFRIIESSSSPEEECEYLATEFDLKTDQLYLEYLEFKKGSVTKYTSKQSALIGNDSGEYSWSSLALGSFSSLLEKYALSALHLIKQPFSLGKKNSSEIMSRRAVTYERRKSPPLSRLNYGLLKKVHEIPNDALLDEDNLVVIESIFIDELKRYIFVDKCTRRHTLPSEILKSIDLRYKSLELMVDTISNCIQLNFDIKYYPIPIEH